MVQHRQSTQKMRMELANTLRPDLDLYDAADPLGASVSRQHNSSDKHCGAVSIHPKDAHGPGEHADNRFGPL